MTRSLFQLGYGAGEASGPSVLSRLVESWPLDEGSGDRTGVNGKVLTDVNTVGVAGAKLGANAAFFVTASSERLEIADEAALRLTGGSFTVALWVYMTSTGSPPLTPLVSKGMMNTGEFCLYRSSTGPSIRFTLDGGTNVAAVGGIGILTWYFVVAWYDQPNNMLHLSVDNAGEVTQAAGTPNAAAATPLYLGNDGVVGRNFGGRLDDVGLWNRMLTADERTYLFNSGTGRAHPYAA